MSFKNSIVNFLTVAMSLISVTVLVLILISNKAKSEAPKESTMSSVQHFKEYVASMIKEQSIKIQTLLKKVQTNAQSVLTKIENIKQDTKSATKENKNKVDIINNAAKFDGHVEAPIIRKNIDINAEARSFNNHYSTTGYGASANANYGTSTYHHHSIGFDPINIVVSMSLLSFLLQALQGLLTRTRLPTPVIEARTLNTVQDWLKKYEDNIPKEKYDLKKKYPKKYLR